MTLRAAVVVLLCMALAVAESVVPFLLHLRAARADLLLIVVLYLALRDDVMQGAALSAVAGYFADLTSATPPFLYTFLAVLTFVVLRMGGSALRTEGGIQSAAVAFGASVVHTLIATTVFGFFTGAGFHLEMAPLFWSALGTASAAPLVFYLLRRMDARLLHAEAAGGFR